MPVRRGKKVKRLFYNYGFPKDPTECHKWVSSPPNKVEKWLNILEYAVDTGSLILLTFEEENNIYNPYASSY